MSGKILVETSARHVHVNQETLEALFGEGYQLTVRKELSQPGQFASNEKVTVKALDENGQPVEIQAEGFEARALQHEIDHLNGILFLDKATNIEIVENN